MESLNQTLFLFFNAIEQPSALALTLAIFFAERLIWAVRLLIGIDWLRGREGIHKAMLVATASALLGLLINPAIGLAWLHPQPFMIGLGYALVPHVVDALLPIDHLTLWWAVSLNFLLQRGPRISVIGLALLRVPIAWARIYLGLHFPLDVVGALSVATFSAWLTVQEMRWDLEPNYRLANGFITGFWQIDCARMGTRVSLWVG